MLAPICVWGKYTWLLLAVAENVKDQPGESHLQVDRFQKWTLLLFHYEETHVSYK